MNILSKYLFFALSLTTALSVAANEYYVLVPIEGVANSSGESGSEGETVSSLDYVNNWCYTNTGRGRADQGYTPYESDAEFLGEPAPFSLTCVPEGNTDPLPARSYRSVSIDVNGAPDIGEVYNAVGISSATSIDQLSISANYGGKEIDLSSLAGISIGVNPAPTSTSNNAALYLSRLDGANSYPALDLSGLQIGYRVTLNSVESLDLSFLSSLPATIEELRVTGAHTSLTGLEGVTDAGYLSFGANVENVDALSNLTSVQVLYLSGSSVLTDISGLSNITETVDKGYGQAWGSDINIVLPYREFTVKADASGSFCTNLRDGSNPTGSVIVIMKDGSTEYAVNRDWVCA